MKVQSQRGQVPTEKRGYIAVIVASFIAFLFALLAFAQGARLHQNQARKAFITQKVEFESQKLVQELFSSPPSSVHFKGQHEQVAKLNAFKGLGELKLKTLTTPTLTQHAALSKVYEFPSQKALTKAPDKAWFDAFWRDDLLWDDAQGGLWAVRTLKHSQEGEWRLVASLATADQPLLPWKSFFWAILCSLFMALLACRKWAMAKTNLARWGLPVASLMSALPILALLCWQIAQRELNTGVLFSGANLIPCLVFLPFFMLALSQYQTQGRASKHRIAYAYITPTLVSVALLVFVPFSIGVALSFMKHSQGQFEWVGLSHFISILSASDYPLSHPLNFYFTLAVTLFWTVANVVLHTSIGLGFALLLNQKGLRFKGIYRALLIIPWAIPNYITALIWRGMFNQQYGLINSVLESLGLNSVAWMSSFWGAMAANISTNTWLGFPFMMVVALGALQSIPSDLYEAARIAGASPWQRFRSITLPLLKPALLPAVILGSVWTFNMFNIIYLVSGGQPGGATDILITEAYRWAFEQDRYGYAAAYSLIIFFILVLYARLTQKMSQAAEEVYQ